MVTQPFLSAPHSVEIRPATDVVHRFDVTSGQWELTAWSYVPTDATGIQAFILCNTYPAGSSFNNNWSLALNLAADHNLVVDWTGEGAAHSLPLVKGQWTEVKVEIDLDLDIQNVFYNNQLLFTGTWTTHCWPGEPPGALRLQAIDLYSSTGSPNYWDDLVLDVGTVTAAPDAPPGAQESTWGAIKTTYR